MEQGVKTIFKEQPGLTSNSYRFECFLSSSQEDDILLRRVNIVVLEQKKLVHAMLLKSREFDKDTDNISE